MQPLLSKALYNAAEIVNIAHHFKSRQVVTADSTESENMHYRACTKLSRVYLYLVFGETWYRENLWGQSTGDWI